MQERPTRWKAFGKARSPFSLQAVRSIRRRVWVLCLLCITSLVVCLSLPLTPGFASPPAPASPMAQPAIQQGHELYDAGRYQEAVIALQQALQTYRAAGDTLRQALTLSNLSLTYQQLGAWEEAEQAIAESLSLLPTQSSDTSVLTVLAQALDIQGRLQLSRGQAEQALTSWEQASSTYEQAGDAAGALDSQINQAQALQALGLYRRAILMLTDLTQTLQEQPNSLRQAIALRSLGNALQVAGNLEQAQQTLQQSLQIAENLRSQLPANLANETIAATTLSLGNIARAQAIATLSQSNLTPDEAIAQLSTPIPADLPPSRRLFEQRKTAAAQQFYERTDTALDLYQQASSTATAVDTHIQAQLNQLNLLVETHRWDRAASLYPTLQTQLANLPPSRTTLYDQINFAQSLIETQAEAPNPSAFPSTDAIAQVLNTASQSAKTLGDTRAQSYAIGTLGNLYERANQWENAKSVTQEALNLSQAIDATDISYRWQWQLGRLLKIQDDKSGAIAAYSLAVNSLQTLRRDLVAINRDVQFSFREGVEPVYRELVDLLLLPDANTQPASERLQQARNVIEGLQIAELDNFFREACLDTAFQLDRVIDQASLPSAVFYTIVLGDRIEIVLKLPQQSLLHYTTAVSREEVESTVEALLAELRQPYPSALLRSLSKKVYDWLIGPAETRLANSNIETLVFVLDGSLRSIPMAALYDGEQYLIEQYSVALAPGLQLPDPKPLQQRQFRALVAGLSEARGGFPELNNVKTEVERIQKDVPSRVLLDESFTRENFQNLLDDTPFSIVHIATHGEFSSNAAETFILAWDSRINVNELSSLLQVQELESPEPIELLVLSACQTATGDRRATLGLAGVAVRAGARSTIASLWNVDDEAGAALMSEFYQQLTSNPISKAEALRRAQLTLLNSTDYRRAPRFWSSFVLLGNWL